jgi:putative addiction module component (TIGR02574 family)
MTEVAGDLLADPLRLEPANRAELVSELIASLDGPSDPDAGTAWAEEVKRRAASLKAGTATIESWEEAKRRIAKDVLRR